MSSSEAIVFYQSAYHAWHFSTVRDWDVYELAQGAKFQTINAPGVGTLKDWLRTQFRVGTYFNRASKRYERVYFVEHSRHFPEMPILAGETVVYRDFDKVSNQKRDEV